MSKYLSNKKACLASLFVFFLSSNVYAQSSEGVIVEADIGYSMLYLPDVNFSLRKQYLFPSPTLETFEDHDGELEDGIRFGLGLYGPQVSLFGTQAVLGIKGFYSHFDDTQDNVNCVAPDNNIACGFSLLVDNPGANEIAIDDNGTFIATTNREVHHYGFSLEARTAANAFNTPLQFKGGLGYRTIEQQTTILGILTGDSVVGGSDTLRYDEDLDTDYYGAYLGVVGTTKLGNNLSLTLDGDIGLYYADVNYSGRTTFDNNTPAATLPGNAPSQDLSLSDNDVAIIASLKAELEQNLGNLKVGIFALGEYYSYAPMIRYNDIDRNNITQGNIDGTRIDDDDAWSFTVGGKVTVPLN